LAGMERAGLDGEPVGLTRIIQEVADGMVAQAFQPVQKNTLLFLTFLFIDIFQKVDKYFEKIMNKVVK
jgi:hypothetical protein